MAISEGDDIMAKILKIKSEMPISEDKIDIITGLLGPSPYDEPPSSIFIHGESGSGKSFVLNKCLSLENYVYAIVNCLESYSMKNVYENILNQLTRHIMGTNNNFEPYTKCYNIMDFVSELKKLEEKSDVGKFDGRSIILIFDKCEILRDVDKKIFPALVKLRELSGQKICVIFISTLPWNHFYTIDYLAQPITIFFEQYDQKQLQRILALTKPEYVSNVQFYDNYLSLFLSVFYGACHDVRELQYQAKLNFKHYYEPIAKGELETKDAGQLWKRSQSFFKKSLKSLYLKVDCNLEVADIDNITSVSSQALIMELPYYSKYLLIGSYIASYNPATEDRRLFVKQAGKKKKSSKIKSEKVKHHLIGPKQFGLQRLFAIVAAILSDDKFALNADLFVEVGSLVKMKLLTQISEDVLDAPTYKCNVSLQFVDVISRNVQFPIRKYLVDFMDS